MCYNSKKVENGNSVRQPDVESQRKGEWHLNVSIIGAGSIGMLFAAYLSQAGHRVTLYTRSTRQAEELNKEGLTLYVGEVAVPFQVNACPLTDETIILDPYIVVAVKHHHLKTVASVIRNNEHEKVYLFVQNGMGHLSFLETLRNCDVLVGVVEHGAIKQSDTTVRHTGYGMVKIASFQGAMDDRHKSLITSWQQKRFPIAFLPDWYAMLANKLVANASINPLTALFGVKNGQLLSNSYFFSLMKGLYEETVSVLEVRDNDLWEHIRSICSQTADNESSMLRDIKAKRRTEIDAINGYILKLGKERGKHLPYTAFVVNAIKGLEQVNEEGKD